MKLSWLFASLLLMFCFTQYAFSESPPPPEAFGFENMPETDQQQVAQQAAVESDRKTQDKEFAITDRLTLEYRTTLERYRFYEVVVLALLAVISLFVVLTFIKSSTQFQPRDMVNATGLVLVIFSTIIIILLADVEVQLTAAMGVLGGIAGFLFGSFNSNVRSEQKPANPPNNDSGN